MCITYPPIFMGEEIKLNNHPKKGVLIKILSVLLLYETLNLVSLILSTVITFSATVFQRKNRFSSPTIKRSRNICILSQEYFISYNYKGREAQKCMVL